MSDVLTPLTQPPGDSPPPVWGDDARAFPSPPLFSSDLPSGARTIRYGTGAAGLAMFGARARNRADRETFRVALAVARFGALDVSHGRHTAMVVPRLGDNFGHPRRTVRVTIILAGDATLTVGGRRVRLGPGGGFIIRGWDAYVYESTSAVTRVHVDIPADVAPFAAALRDVEPTIWAADSPVLFAVGAALVEMIRRESGTTEPATRDGLRRMAEALTLSVIATPSTSSVELSAAARQRARVLSHIAAHHPEPGLNASSLATDLGISTRTLQRLFAGEDRGVAEEIAAARLHHALALLQDPLLVDASLDEVATRSGFGTVARLRRAVRTATGMCPGEYRAQFGSATMAGN